MCEGSGGLAPSDLIEHELVKWMGLLKRDVDPTRQPQGSDVKELTIIANVGMIEKFYNKNLVKYIESFLCQKELFRDDPRCN